MDENLKTHHSPASIPSLQGPKQPPGAVRDGREGSKIRTLILKLSGGGMSNSKIGQALHISQRQLTKHLKQVDNGDMLAAIVHLDPDLRRRAQESEDKEREPAA